MLTFGSLGSHTLLSPRSPVFGWLWCLFFHISFIKARILYLVWGVGVHSSLTVLRRCFKASSHPVLHGSSPKEEGNERSHFLLFLLHLGADNALTSTQMQKVEQGEAWVLLLICLEPPDVEGVIWDWAWRDGLRALGRKPQRHHQSGCTGEPPTGSQVGWEVGAAPEPAPGARHFQMVS